MLRHVIAPLRRYTKASHDVVQHPRLNSDAKILLLYVQGLPEGSTERPLSAHAERLGIKGRAYQKVKQSLTACGYLHEWRHQNERGRWVTDQLLANVHLTTEEAAAVRDGDVPSTHMRTVGEPEPQVAGDYPPVDKNEEKNTPNPPPDPPDDPDGPDGPDDPEQAVAEDVLLSLRQSRRELHLGVSEARTLSAIAADWLRRGISPADLRYALTSTLPPNGVRSAVGFLRHRLTVKMPPQRALVPRTPDSPPRTDRLPKPLITCEGPGSEHVFRPVGDETQCGHCRQEAAWKTHIAKYPPLAPDTALGAN
ncbi:hypothetical protein [Streptomyces chryseus]|uniref:Helix-turn-helix domain-containing protein n=1 Tax=Streptomyces chryseus TaxID=68186 RepID=A0ABQ3DWN2_9ACTN|nr:hypothetical protein [Streptomyces chryseus]GHB16204.1 hypothetical protein GCM10010346_44950 [Streptomyces chryseus]